MVIVRGVRNEWILDILLKEVLIGFPDGLDVVCESKKGAMNDSKDFWFFAPSFIDITDI